jgi:hypothetical protein
MSNFMLMQKLDEICKDLSDFFEVINPILFELLGF